MASIRASIRQFVILAGGKGTRLGAHAAHAPKPMMQISPDTVFLDYIIDNAARQGFSDIIIVAGHLGAQIHERYHHAACRQANISVFIEPEARGTGGALTFIAEHLADEFIVTNGDTFFDFNLRALAARLEEAPALDAVMALREVDDVGRYGAVECDASGLILRFCEKDESRLGQSGTINGGAYALRRRVLDLIEGYPVSIETDLFPRLTARQSIATLRGGGYFIDIGLPETLTRAREVLPQRRRPVLFLDRDGVLNHDVHYLHAAKDWQWIDGAIDTIRAANDAGVAVVVVTNQAGIGRGKYRECDLLALHGWLGEVLHARGAFIDALYYSPYHPEAGEGPYRVMRPFDRKPSPVMLQRALRQHKLDGARALFVGDQDSDAGAADACGVPFLRYASGNLHDLVTAHSQWAVMCDD